MAVRRTREINRFRVMRSIWLNRTISRVEIAKSLHLDKSTITSIVSELLAVGLVYETATGEAGPQGGRKPVFLEVNKDFGCVIGIEIQPESYSVVVVNMHGEILYTHRVQQSTSRDNLVEVFLAVVKETRARLADFRIPVFGVGVGVSGIVNQRDGKIRYSIPLGITEGFDFLSAISGLVDIPVYVGNDANCCAWGEIAFHRTESLKNFLFSLVEFRLGETLIDIHKGIAVGLGIVIGGRVYYGEDQSAGEFKSAFWRDGNSGQFSLDDGEMLAVERDRMVLTRFLQELSKNLAILVNTFDLNQIYLGGDIERFSNVVEPILAEEIKRNWSYPMQTRCEIRFSSLGEKAVAYGAAGMFLGQLFTHNYPAESDDIDMLIASQLLPASLERRNIS